MFWLCIGLSSVAKTSSWVKKTRKWHQSKVCATIRSGDVTLNISITTTQWPPQLQNIWKMWNIHFRKKCLILMFLRIKFSTPYWKKNQFGQFLHIVHWVAAILEKGHGLPLQMVSKNSEKKSQFIWPKMAPESKRATWKSKKVGKWNTLVTSITSLARGCSK